MFGAVIGKIFSSFLPVGEELFLFDATLYSVEVHVKGFGPFPEHVDGEDDLGGCVLSIH